ncbi:MAG TPA: tyrosine-type recombinase/integrase [Pyrinomonadaceae bacterium]|jgi:integrase
MAIKRRETALIRVPQDPLAAIRNAVELWAGSTTTDGLRKDDLLRDKKHVVTAFFLYINKHPAKVRPADIRRWLDSLHERGLRPTTVYQRACLLSSFYSWALRDRKLGSQIRSNPVVMARPKAPKAYQSESSQSLTDEELESLVSAVRRKAESGDIVGKRDYAILLMFMASGKRRTEVLSLRGRDIKVDTTLIVNNRIKGGDYVRYEIADPEVKDALIAYLTEARRLNVLRNDAPLWTRHDYAGRPGAPLSSHCFALNMKRYARIAGIEGFHLHRMRHTFARIISEETGSITATQEALDHRNPSTTRVYVQRIAIKRDQYSQKISSRWGKARQHPK